MNDKLAGLYLHLPFCRRVCPYCDFSVRTGDEARRRRFVDTLLQEIELHRDCELRFDTIYFGGGTPSLIDAADLRRIVDRAGESFDFTEDRRIFLEANPEDVTPERLRAWRDLGVETLSLGVQSLDADALAYLGREHSPEDARRAVEQARAVGFGTLSVDLIYGLPQQSEAQWAGELARALQLEVDHLSCYQLTIHRRTRFGLLRKRGELREASEDLQGAFFRMAHGTLNAAGMQGYEVSQFARAPEHRSRHNMKYWDHSPYLGLGPSAHSFHGDRRWSNLPRSGDWQASVESGRLPSDFEERLDGEALRLERLMTGFRTYAGVDTAQLAPLRETQRRRIGQWIERGLLRTDGTYLRPTLEGLAIADRLAAEFDL